MNAGAPVNSSCSTSGTRRVNLVTNPVISHEWGKGREVFTTSETYTWSFVTQIFHNCQPSHGGDVKLPKWWLQLKTIIYRSPWFSSFLVSRAVILYQENSDRNHKLWNIVSTERYNGKIETTCIWSLLS